MANIMNMFPGGGGAEVMSGTAVYVSSVVSYTNNTLTLKSGGTGFTTGSTWNYELAF